MALPERQLEAVIEAAEAGGSRPVRLYAMYDDTLPAPALYAEFSVSGQPSVVPVIAHNLRYYELGMRRWDVGFVELLVLNELHELTHWAMTDEEREYFDELARRHGRGDGYWLNPVLLDLIDWLPRGHPTVLDRSSMTARIRPWLRSALVRLRRLLRGDSLVRGDS